MNTELAYDLGPWFSTYTGKKFFPLSPDPADIDIEDVAHSLALLNRWCGHSTVPFSVAQHSLLVSQVVDPEHALWGLLHDAAEAYIGDLPRPVKAEVERFRRIDRVLSGAISVRFGLGECPTEVKVADTRMLVTEARDLLRHRPEAWDRKLGVEPYPFTIEPADWKSVKIAFLERFYDLMEARNA